MRDIGRREAIRVVVVEDHPDIRELYAEFLTIAGFAVSLAGDGDEALTVIAACDPHVVVLDFHLPKRDGLSVLAALRQDPARTSIPVIVLSADARPHVAERAAAAGANCYCAKPCLPEVLEAEIRKLVQPRGD